MANISNTTPNAEPEKPVPPINGADPVPPIEEPRTDAEKAKVKKVRAKKNRAEKEGRPPLPEITEPPPEIPPPSAARQFDEDLISDEDDEDLSSEAPVTWLKIYTRLPRTYLQVMPKQSVIVSVIRLDQEDRRPNQIDAFVLTKHIVPYFRDTLDQEIIKMVARVFTILQGQPRFLLHPATSELASNSWNISRRELLLAGQLGWIMPRSHVSEGRYGWRPRDADLAPVEPNFPIDPFRPVGDEDSLFKRSLIREGRLITDKDHRIAARLRGEEEEEHKGDGV